MNETTMASQQLLTETANVYVRLLVDDGNQFDLVLRSDSPMLADLVAVLRQRSHHHCGGKLFKIPIDDGASSFFLSSESLVAIATDPPLEIAEQLAEANQIGTGEASPISTMIASDFVQFDNFLYLTENQALLDYMLTHESEYQSPGNERSLAESFAAWRTQLLNRIAAVIPQVLTQLEIPNFPLPTIEAVEFPHLNHPYQVASDNSTAETCLRVLNFIYYFGAVTNPQNFGSLRIYDSQLIGDRCQSAKTFKTVAPRNNRIVFFFSSYSHEVLPVTSATQTWADGCFKFNGWLRRPDSAEIFNS